MVLVIAVIVRVALIKASDTQLPIYFVKHLCFLKLECMVGILFSKVMLCLDPSSV